MKNMEYIVADPAGNTTGLVLTEIAAEEHKEVAGYLLTHSPHGLEQVGFIKECGDCDGRLEMMGGEFCGNASRSFGLYLTRMGRSEKSDRALIRVSGAKGILEVQTDPSGKEARIRMPDIRNITTLEAGPYGPAPLVVMEGICHLILKGHTQEKEEAENLVRRLAPELGIEAFGIMYYDEEENFMTPLVWVRETDTMFWESSCGSGSVALASFLKKDQEGPWHLSFREPGGTLAVEKDATGSIYLGGPVTFSNVIQTKVP